MAQNSSEKKRQLNNNLKVKSIVIPIVFAIVTVIICIVIFNSNISIFPNGHHNDALTTTAPTQTTEFDENEFTRNSKD